MLVLPNTPPLPRPWPVTNLSPDAAAARAALPTLPPQGHTQLVRCITSMEAYVGLLCRSTQSAAMCEGVPWSGVRAPKCAWTVASETQMAALCVLFLYLWLGAELSNVLFDADPSSEPLYNDSWRRVQAHYKASMALAHFGARCAGQVDPALFVLARSLGNIGVQLSALCKHSAVNRRLMSAERPPQRLYNAVLCRVAVYTVEQMKLCQSLVRAPPSGPVALERKGWELYLGVVLRYAEAYAALFLALEKYVQGECGHAIGLVNYGLVSLQSRDVAELKRRKKYIAALRRRLVARRATGFIESLESTTRLALDKLLFSKLSGIVLADLSFLFDELVACHLRFSKENDNIHFQEVVDWRSIEQDSRWPMGKGMPVGDVPEYTPQQAAPAHPGQQYF